MGQVPLPQGEESQPSKGSKCGNRTGAGLEEVPRASLRLPTPVMPWALGA